MRLTTEEILENRPFLNLSGRDYDTVQGRYYGDLPVCTLSTEFSTPDNPTLCNLEAVDVYIARRYAPEPVEKYLFCHGDGYRISGGRLISGALQFCYGGGLEYSLFVQNGHAGQRGFWIGKADTGTFTYTSYATPGFNFHPWPDGYCRDTIDREKLDRIFRYIEKQDEFGGFAKLVVRTARGFMERSGY